MTGGLRGFLLTSSSAVLYDRDGSLLLVHRKINILTELMSPPYTPGRNDSSNVRAVDTHLGRIGILICADTFKENLLDLMQAAKPSLVIVPYGWAANSTEWPAHGADLINLVSHVANRTHAVAVGVDLVGNITHGPWTGQTYGGFSAVAAANGTVLARGWDRKAELGFVDVDL
mmetsp:Transcript_58575/g.137942  ORF Transcript_58575/g.137942 Transcript_58575/m.137942 type:complete len:173 (-) Transcript_58575:37-555(-)